MDKKDLALNKPQGFICNKTVTNIKSTSTSLEDWQWIKIAPEDKELKVELTTFWSFTRKLYWWCNWSDSDSATIEVV